MYTVYKTIKYTTSKGLDVEVITQIYRTGIYAIINGDPKEQYNLTPEDYSEIVKGLQNDYDKGKIKDLEFGSKQTVTIGEDGLLHW